MESSDSNDRKLTYPISPVVTRRRAAGSVASAKILFPVLPLVCSVTTDNNLQPQPDAKPYCLNVQKAINNKISATNREQMSCKMTGGGLVIHLSTAYYEGFKAGLIQHLIQTEEISIDLHNSQRWQQILCREHV